MTGGLLHLYILIRKKNQFVLSILCLLYSNQSINNLEKYFFFSYPKFKPKSSAFFYLVNFNFSPDPPLKKKTFFQFFCWFQFPGVRIMSSISECVIICCFFSFVMCVSLSILDCWTLLYKNTKTIWKQNKNSQIISQNSEKFISFPIRKWKNYYFKFKFLKN
jgi:hypothetical protein